MDTFLWGDLVAASLAVLILTAGLLAIGRVVARGLAERRHRRVREEFIAPRWKYWQD